MIHLRYQRGQCQSSFVSLCSHEDGHIALLSSSSSVAIYNSTLVSQPHFLDGDGPLTSMVSTNSLIVVGDLLGYCYAFLWQGQLVWKRQILDSAICTISPLVPLGSHHFFFAATERDVAFHSTRSVRTVRELLPTRECINALDASPFGCLVGTPKSAVILSSKGEAATMKALCVTSVLDMSPLGFVIGTHEGDIHRVFTNGMTKVVPAHNSAISKLMSGFDESSTRILSLGSGGVASAWTEDCHMLWSVGTHGVNVVAAAVSIHKDFVVTAAVDGAIRLHRWNGRLARSIRTSPICHGCSLLATHSFVCLGQVGGECRLWKIDPPTESICANTQSSPPMRVTRRVINSNVVIDVSPIRERVLTDQASHPETVVSTNAFEASIFQWNAAQFIAAKSAVTLIDFANQSHLDDVAFALTQCHSFASHRVTVGATEDSIKRDSETFACNLKDPSIIRGLLLASAAHNFVLTTGINFAPIFRGLAFVWLPGCGVAPPTGSVISFPFLILAGTKFDSLLETKPWTSGFGAIAILQSRSGRVVDDGEQVAFSPFTTFQVGAARDAVETLGFVNPPQSVKCWMLYEFHVAC